MKNTFLLAIFILFISCKNEPNPESSNIVEKEEIYHSLKTDTIFFNYSKKSLKDGYVVINFISKEYKCNMPFCIYLLIGIKICLEFLVPFFVVGRHRGGKALFTPP